jgi:hypothetical protein
VLYLRSVIYCLIVAHDTNTSRLYSEIQFSFVFREILVTFCTSVGQLYRYMKNSTEQLLFFATFVNFASVLRYNFPAVMCDAVARFNYR